MYARAATLAWNEATMGRAAGNISTLSHLQIKGLIAPPLSDPPLKLSRLRRNRERWREGQGRSAACAYAPRSSVRAAAAMPDWRRDLSMLAGWLFVDSESRLDRDDEDEDGDRRYRGAGG